MADVFKFESVVPAAFRIAARIEAGQLNGAPEGHVRRACRDAFRDTNLLAKIIPGIEEMLAAGGLELPPPPDEAMPVAFEEERGLGDVGHRG